MTNTIEMYTQQREAFLQNLVEKLSSDERFVSAWVTGSFAKGQQDVLSDIDITLVVADEHCEILCTRPRMVSAQTTKERFDLYSLFGQPAFLHENNHNAPEAGTFTFVAYAQLAIMVDWVLRPQRGAKRPEESRLLFDKVGIPIQLPAEPENQEQNAERASEIIAFFWMMTAVTLKYVQRDDAVFVAHWLEELTRLVHEVERRIQARDLEYKRGSYSELKVTPAEQIEAIRQLCERMEKLMPEVERQGGYVSKSPMCTIEIIIGIVQEKYGMPTPTVITTS
jgi:predicted nucleotidyltransferase